MYQVRVSNATVAVYDEKSNIITALDYGDTQVKLTAEEDEWNLLWT